MDMRTAQQRAISRALAHGGAAAVSRVRYGTYKVESSTRPGASHTVSVDATGAYRCTCEAGLASHPCWHAGAVYSAMVVLARGGGVRPPATPLAPSNVVAFRQRAA